MPVVDNKFDRVEADSPVRCQGKYTHGQCPYRQVPGSTYCPMHGGHGAINAAKAADLRMYRLTKWKDRMSEFADSEQVKGLREEIGILRIVLEETVNKCQDTTDILMASSKIGDLALKIEKLVSSCHRLEASTGMLLDKTAALHLASVIVAIIGKHVTDADAIDLISSEIISAIVETRTEVKTK